VAHKHYDASRWVSSFVGFAPADDARVAALVIVDEPEGGHLGGAVAAPVWKEIVEQALRYLHVPPSSALLARKAATASPARGPDGAAGASRAPPGSAGSAVVAASADATTDADELPGSDVADVAVATDTDGDGDTEADGSRADGATSPGVLGRDDTGDAIADDGAPPAGDDDDAAAAGGRRPVAETVTVPDFTGLTIAAVLRAAHRSGVQLAFDEGQAGSGVALDQRPRPGPAGRGVVCRIVFGRRE